MTRLSRFTIAAPVPGRKEVLLVQPLAGQAALVDAETAEALKTPDGQRELAEDESARLREAALLVGSDAEDDRLLEDARRQHRRELEVTPTQLVVVPSFGCNLRCTYCYQHGFEPEGRGLISPETLRALFTYIDRFHAAEEPRPYLTVFGGEPLIESPAHRDRLERLLDYARARSLEVAVVTNGFELSGFVPLLAAAPVKEVQVTLDGPRAVHDARRPHLSGAGSFDRVVAGMDAALAAGLSLNLRVVVDGENLEALPELARLAATRGWLDLPESRFKTQLGRNYELFACAAGPHRDALLGRLELWSRFVALAEAHPELRRFHRPRFHGLRHLVETGELPAPNFDACPAAKKEWAFGPDGGIYGCTATVGHSQHRLGRFAPDVLRDETAIARLQGRSTFSIPRCQRCELAPICGGGCAALAARERGDLLGPDCRPVRELLGLGAAYYRLGLEGA